MPYRRSRLMVALPWTQRAGAGDDGSVGRNPLSPLIEQIESPSTKKHSAAGLTASTWIGPSLISWLSIRRLFGEL
jgi:hypothetical protein